MRNIQVVNFALGEYQRRAIFLQQKVEGLIVPSLNLQHQLDVGPHHSVDSIANTRVAIKLQGTRMFHIRGSVPEDVTQGWSKSCPLGQVAAGILEFRMSLLMSRLQVKC